MGMFDAQIVVRTVENVVAVDEADLHNANAKLQKLQPVPKLPARRDRRIRHNFVDLPSGL